MALSLSVPRRRRQHVEPVAELELADRSVRDELHERRAGAGDATAVAASVGSSAFSDVAGIPNTVQGFADALLKLRDLYAPNAILAIHASAWGGGIDIASDRTSSVNAVTEADKTAAFLDSAGITSNP